MPWTRGEGTTDHELLRVQLWIEWWDLRLEGGNGKGIGMYAEWQDFKSKRQAFETFVKVGVGVVGALSGIVAILVGLSAIGIVHLR